METDDKLADATLGGCEHLPDIAPGIVSAGEFHCCAKWTVVSLEDFFLSKNKKNKKHFLFCRLHTSYCHYDFRTRYLIQVQ